MECAEMERERIHGFVWLYVCSDEDEEDPSAH